MWSNVLTVIALLLIIEGLIPFISPEMYKKMMSQLLQLPEQIIRRGALVAMLSGVLLLYAVNP